MRVLWVGAGASIEGGYPSALKLLAKMEEEVTVRVVEEGVRAAWTRYAKFRDEATGTERALLSSTNPEVVLSVPDLLDAARIADDQRIEMTLVAPAIHARRDRRAGRPADDTAASISPETIEREYAREERRRLDDASRARDALLHVLDDFFGRRHYDDGTAEGYERRAYLRRELSDLQDGDVVITTNWDTMIERTLLEDGRWSPLDGYGFEARLAPVSPEFQHAIARGRNRRSPPTWPTWVPKRSAVRVLKIHGSFGWRTPMRYGTRVETPGRVYLDHARLLSVMPLVRPGVGPDPGSDDLCLLWDETEPAFYEPSDRPLYVYPSYLKQITGTTLQEIWDQADRALRRASELRALGASLPEADGAVRALLNPLRRRAQERTIRITVDDPLRTTHERWRSFLGHEIVTRQRKAGEP